ncbi:hypothetical protein [Ensifer aridi]|uniref:hypothetical protein n=1 Tax=Ensifer aridi TaxID=1708715 RepID=UPI00358F692A
MIYTTASDVYATTALTPFARNILDDATAGAALTTLGVSAFIQTVLDDSDAATARATLGADNASNLTAGTVPSARIAGAYTGFTQAQITSDGEALSLIGSATGDPYVAFWKAAVRQGYIQHRDDGSNIGFIWSNDIATGGATLLCLLNTGGVDGLRYRVGATNHTVWHSGNLTAADLGAAVTTTDIIAGNGLTGGGAISADRTLALGTPSNITNSTTNSVTADSHTHALGFTAAEVYTGTNATETANLPVGHVIFSAMVDRPNNNATVTIRLSGTTGYLNGGSETVLSGTWRHRGGYTASGDRFGVFQRVA